MVFAKVADGAPHFVSASATHLTSFNRDGRHFVEDLTAFEVSVLSGAKVFI